VRYLIVGGLAVVAHGYVRFTADFDVVLDLEAENVQRALGVFKSLGYVPRVPVPIEQFAEAICGKLGARQRHGGIFAA
jgi:hypothetical protein